MNKKLLGLGLSMALFLISCEKDNTGDSPIPQEQQTFHVETNQTELSKSLNFDNSGVIGITSVGSTRDQESNNLIGIEQIAFINPPTIEGEILRATDVDFKDDFIYVAYTKEGEDYLGGIDIIDISDEHNPLLVNRVLSPYADINAISIDGDQLYFIGAYFAGDDNPDRAFIGSTSLRNGEFSNDVAMKINVTGYTGVEILQLEESFISLTGSNGILGHYDINSENEITTLDELSITDLRSADYKNGKLAVLSGDQGILLMRRTNDGFEIESKTATTTLIPESKRKIAWFQNQVIVPEGPSGAGIYNLLSNSLTKSLPIHSLPEGSSVSNDDKVTNAVSTNEDYVFMANGGAGLSIAKLSEDINILAEGIAEIDGSSNYVEAKGDYVFVASGEGLKILKLSKPKNDSGSSEYFAMCAEYPRYDGNPNFNVNSNEEKNYSGSANVNNLNVNGNLTFCGSINSKHGININSNGVFNMNGSMAVGRYGKREDLNINSNAVLRIQGSVTIYSNLNLNSGATLEFVGENSTIHIFGEVRKGDNVTVKGDYTDTSNKL